MLNNKIKSKKHILKIFSIHPTLCILFSVDDLFIYDTPAYICSQDICYNYHIYRSTAGGGSGYYLYEILVRIFNRLNNYFLCFDTHNIYKLCYAVDKLFHLLAVRYNLSKYFVWLVCIWPVPGSSYIVIFYTVGEEVMGKLYNRNMKETRGCAPCLCQIPTQLSLTN